MSRRVSLDWLGLAVLVVASAVTRAVAAREFTVPWIVPDEMIYALVGTSLWDHGTLAVRGLETPYYSLVYPALIGLPLQLGTLADGIRAAQALQAVAMSLAAVPVFVWGRRFLPERLALAAAGLTLLLPALAYSGLLMSEALFYPLTVVALAALARTLERPTAWNQGVFLLAVTLASAVRLQALVLLPALALGALAHARITRSWATVRGLAALLALAALATVASLAYGLAAGGDSWRNLLGAYSTLGEEAGLSADIAAEAAWHLAGVGLLTLGLPLVATVVLCGQALGRGEEEPAPAAFLATIAAYTVLLVGQVALFAATQLDHVSERYLFTAAPPLFLALCLWLARGIPRPRVLTSVAMAGLAALAVLVPVDRIASEPGVHDLPSSVSLIRLGDALSEGWVRVALVCGALLVGATAFALRPRAAPAVLAAIAVGLAAQSAVATHEIANRSEGDQRRAVGLSPRWLERAEGRVTLVASADRPWTADARAYFWNPSLRDVVSVDEARRLVPTTVLRATIRDNDGVIIDADGEPVSRVEVAAPATLVLAGTRLEQEEADGAETVPLVHWRTDGVLRVVERHAGFQPNGDVTDEARVLVTSCRQGRLELTLLGKSGAPIDVFVNGSRVRTLAPQSGETLHAAIPSPRYADGTAPCFYELHTSNLFGTTRVAFVAL